MSGLAVGVALAMAAPAAAVTSLTTYMQFFQTSNAKAFVYTPHAASSTLVVSGTGGRAIALAYVKAPYTVGDQFVGTFTLSTASTAEVIFNVNVFEQPGHTGTFSFTGPGGLNVLTLNFSGGVLTRTTGTTPTVSLLAECPCGITWSSDVFELPASSIKDFAFSLNALEGPDWSAPFAKAGGSYFGEPFRATG
ncbi:hypothetical protein, partial [Thermaurantiacus sp.]